MMIYDIIYDDSKSMDMGICNTSGIKNAVCICTNWDKAKIFFDRYGKEWSTSEIIPRKRIRKQSLRLALEHGFTIDE